jgi:uncharacterized protein
MQEFLGFGLLRPFRRDQKADFAAAGGGALIRSAVGQILGTVGSSDFTQGELPWRTEFGSLLHLLRHQKNDRVLQELARVYVVDALKRWEPRVVMGASRGSDLGADRARAVGRRGRAGDPASLQRHLDERARQQRHPVGPRADRDSMSRPS